MSIYMNNYHNVLYHNEAACRKELEFTYAQVELFNFMFTFESELTRNMIDAIIHERANKEKLVNEFVTKCKKDMEDFIHLYMEEIPDDKKDCYEDYDWGD